MSESAELEQAYRRLVACYPRSFRRENEDEIVTVLLATAQEGQRRPGIGESADLIRGAVRMRMGLSRTPCTVLNAVRLMYLGALAELGVLVTLLMTEDSIRAAVSHRFPQLTAAQLGSVNSILTVDAVGAVIAIGLWLFLGWANGMGSQLGRLGAVVCFAFNTVMVIVDLATDAVQYAPAVLIGAGAVWLIGLAAIANLLRKQSWAYYERRAVL